VVAPAPESCDDAREGAALRRGTHHDDRLSFTRARRTTVEVHDAAYARMELRTDRVGADLPSQVDLRGGADRGHPAVASDDRRVVHILCGLEGESRVVVQSLVKARGTHGETGDNLAHIHRLAGAGYCAAFNHFQQTLGNEFRMDAEVALASQVG
jgi:hypothetical protein